MNTNDKQLFIHNIFDSVKAEINAKIDDGSIPNNWDGIELRQLIADKFNQEIYKMDRKRMSNYRNTVLVSNL